jgi:hypothetical protein
MSQGWQCPACNAVMSPAMAVCVNCTGRTVSSGGVGIFPPNSGPGTLCPPLSNVYMDSLYCQTVTDKINVRTPNGIEQWTLQQ